jgi:eukaryotic-like serine/threonine-protein kinase
MIGTRLGQYRIDALLGQGGMGAVYLATDEMLGRHVAIKVLRDDADVQGTATGRFRSEAQILSRLDHPHILRLYGFSQHEGVLYMVTEFVRGEALQRRLERGAAMDTSQVLEWSGHVLDALHYAHQLGVVHRDIKPANILIDERNRARLLDFGVARIVGTEGPTQTGHAVGTLTYMAPEQVLDESIDGRADLYAFAIVLCQMFAGRRPYRSTTTAGLIREIVDGPAPDVAAMLPPQAAVFAPALLHALARHPVDRTASAGQMHDELMAAARGPLLSLPPLPRVHERAMSTSSPPLTQAISTGGVTTAPRVGPTAIGTQPTPTGWTTPVAPLALVVAAMLLAAAGGIGWYLLAPTRLVTPRVAIAPAESPSPSAAMRTVAPSQAAAGVTGAPPRDVAAAGTAMPTTAAASAAPSTSGSSTPGSSTSGASSPPSGRPASDGQRRVGAGGRRGPAPEPAASPVAEPAATPPDPAPAAAPEPEAATPEPETTTTAAAVPATVVFKDIILMDRIDDEDEELDVSMRLDATRVVVIDEDGLAKRSIAYDAIDRATYNSRKPGRFSLRRGASHWLTLEVGTTPIVLRLNGRTYEQVLSTLQGHGVRVERNP